MDVKSKTILELTFLVTAVSSLFGIVRFTINIKKKLYQEDSFIAQMSLPEV